MKTTSEDQFERFLIENHLKFEKIDEDRTPRPDYLVHIGDNLQLMFEVKELAVDENFKTQSLEVSSRIVGDHIRQKINNARKQMRFASEQGIPSILMIYNNLDPLHLFGSEDMDFETAMYGEYTLQLNKETREIENSFYGRNQSVRENWNTEFSAIGRLSPRQGKLTVTLFENVFSKIALPYGELPLCFEIKRVEISG